MFISSSPPEIRDYPTRIELGRFYLNDSREFLHRFKVTFFNENHDFQSLKSLRMKSYTDLHFSMECLLKCIVCLRQKRNLSGERLVKKIRNYNHRLEKLYFCAIQNAVRSPNDDKLIEDCNRLGVFVRYQFDEMNLRSKNDTLYYKTIGNDSWISAIVQKIELGQNRTSKAFCTIRSVHTGEDLVSEYRRTNVYN